MTHNLTESAQLKQLQDSFLKIEGLLSLRKPRLEQRFTFSSSEEGKDAVVFAALDAMPVVGMTPILKMPEFWPSLRSICYNPFTGWNPNTLYAGPADGASFTMVAEQLIQHIQQQLKCCGVKLGPGGFELQNVRTQQYLGFSVELPAWLRTKGYSHLVFEGGCDAVVVPWGELLWYRQLRVVFDWKRPQDLCWDNIGGGTMQTPLQMLGALAHSEHPALVVSTDGCNFIVLQPSDVGIRYLQTLDASTPGYFSSEEAFRLVVYHLTQVCSSKPMFLSAQPDVEDSSELKQQLQLLLGVQKVVDAVFSK